MTVGESIFDTDEPQEQEQAPQQETKKTKPEPKLVGEVFLVPQPKSLYKFVKAVSLFVAIFSTLLACVMIPSMLFGASGFIAVVSTGFIAIPITFLAGYLWFILFTDMMRTAQQTQTSNAEIVQWANSFNREFRNHFPRWVFTREIRASKAPFWLLEQKTYGVAGDLAQATGKFSAHNIAAGEAGEKKTAELLNELAGIPGIRVFHGLDWGTGGADIDHAVLCENRVAIIDSKNWAGKTHVMDSKGQVTSVLTDGTHKEREIRFHHAIETMQEVLPEAEIRAFLAVHGDATFDNMETSPLSMDSPERTIAAVKHWLTFGGADSPDVVEVHVDMASKIHNLVKSPLSE